jgi:hypothetical protein
MGTDERYLGTVGDILGCEGEQDGIAKELFYAAHDAINELVYGLDNEEEQITLTLEMRQYGF